MRPRFWIMLLLLFAAASSCRLLQRGGGGGDPEVQAFLDEFTAGWLPLYRASSEAWWVASTDVSEKHTKAAIEADKALSAYTGSPEVIRKVRGFLERGTLSELQRRQLQKLLLMAAEHPGTVPELVAARIEAEGEQSRLQDGFTFRMRTPDGGEREVTPNQIDDILRNSTDLDERLAAWEAAKSIGKVLRPGLLRLRQLRNAVAREMGYPGFFSLQVADYGMTAEEMMELMERIVEDTRPLYRQLHCWAKRHLAERYGADVPRRIPAHWLPNRWGQEWPGLVEAVDLDPVFANLEPEEIVKLAEDFYVSMGFERLPPTFWERSDLYELPADAPRKKNRHASAWHIDLDKDVRSLMSVKPDFNWFTTAHHELGHIYYYLSYSRPQVPPLLREGANRAFHEGIGELISLAASQRAYLRDVGLLPEDAPIDEIQWLLNDALTSIVFLPWAAGVMSRFEYEFYDGDLPEDRINARWWELKRKYQGIDPPSPRGEEWCDPATKTHINDDPAQYYDYAIATVLKFQLHEHIARDILGQDVRNANYRGSREVGDFLRSILEVGATRDWREVVREATGEDLSGRAMLEYYRPLLEWLERENAGCDCSFEEEGGQTSSG